MKFLRYILYAGALASVIAQNAPAQGPPPSTADFNCDNTGKADASVCLNSAITSLKGGGVLALARGTFKIESATVSLGSNTCLVGAGAGATTLTATGPFATVTILNALNACVRNLTIRSMDDGILIRTTNVDKPSEYALVENVNIDWHGSNSAGIHLSSPTCCVYWSQFSNVNITNGGLPEQRVGYLLDGLAGNNMRPLIYGGRVADARYGINVVSAEHMILQGTEFDDIVSSGAGVAIWLHSGVLDSQITPRLEAWGVEAPIDKDWQFDAGSRFNNIYLASGYSGAPSRGTDAGTGNCVIGGNGSGGLTNYCLNPQITGNVTVTPGGTLAISSGALLSLPGAIDQELNLGGALTGPQLSTTKSLATIRVPASESGTALTTMADGSDGASIITESHDFNSREKTGRSCQFGSTGVSECTANGGNTASPIVLGSTMPGGDAGVQIPAIPVNRLPICTDANEGTHKSVIDARTAVFNAPVLTGGEQHVDAYCAGTASGWRVH